MLGERIEYTCGTCSGSGEGRYEGSTCPTCGGTGVEYTWEEPSKPEPAEPSDDEGEDA